MRGTGARKVALLGDYESELRHPMLFRLLRRAGVSQDYFFYGTAGEPGLMAALQRADVKVVCPLGEHALQQVLGESDIARWRGRTIEHRHLPGRFIMPLLQPSRLMSRRSEAEDDPQDQLKRHPPRFHGTFMVDLHKALHVAEHGFIRLPTRYIVDPESAVFWKFIAEYEAALAADPFTMLSWDIETAYKQKHKDESEFDAEEIAADGTLLRISFCFKPGYAISVTWSPTYDAGIRRLLASRGLMVTWNGRTFDVPRVQLEGYEVNGTIIDGMDAYHMLESDLPKGLEWVSSEATDLLPWKHLSAADPGLYSAIDPDAALRNVLYINEKFKLRGQASLFERHVTRLMPILDRAGAHGNLMDRKKRDEIRGELITMRDKLVEEIQQFVPRELFPRKRYERLPEALEGTDDPTSSSWPSREHRPPVIAIGKDNSEWDIVFEREAVNTCSVCGLIATNKTEHFKGSKEPHPDKPGKLRQVKNPCKLAGATIGGQPWWVPKFLQLLSFNPNSSDQLKAYMRHFGHPLGKDKKNAQKETADANHLKALHKKHGAKFPIYSKTLVVHKVSKTIGTYTPEPDANDLIHTQYTNSTATWRLGSRKVLYGTQIQNWGKRKEDAAFLESLELAEQFVMKVAATARKQIIARPGHKLIQIDSSAVEAVMQGYYMNDTDYMRLASKSIHAWLCCLKLGLQFTPPNVDIVKEKHAGLYSKMKVTNYLTNFGGGPGLMAATYPEEFPTKRIAEETQEELYRLLPTLKAYHHAVRWEAHTKTFLQSPWGYRHSYYDVFKKNNDGTLALSKDSKRCVAFKPQNSNSGFQKDNIILTAVSPIDGPPILDLDYVDANWEILEREMLAGNTWARFMPTNVTIHDSECLDTEAQLEQRATEALLAIFTRPIPQMRGLRVGAEVEVGLNWAEMERTARIVVDNYGPEHTEAGVALAA